MSGIICAALRDLDPVVGGAEMSLSLLLQGIVEPGPLSENPPQYIPFIENPEKSSEVSWGVKILQSSDRGDSEWSQGNNRIERKCIDLPVEDLWSGLAWRFRNKKTGARNTNIYRKHIVKRNKQFGKWVENELIGLKDKCALENKQLVGVTQLTWSIGACNAFRNLDIPHAIFVRDNIQITNTELYRESLESADVVIGAGKGLINQLNKQFKLKSTKVVHLPINFTSRFKSLEYIEERISSSMAERKEEGSHLTPRVGIMGIVPEKGHDLYKKLFPYLKNKWPELEIHIFGQGHYIDSLKDLGNTVFHGNTSPEDAFPIVDIHMLMVNSLGTWGRVINEAGIFKIPTLSIDIGSQKEAVGEGGFVVAKNANLEEITYSLKELYQKREEMGKRAQKHAEIVDHRRAISEFRSVITQISNSDN